MIKLLGLPIGPNGEKETEALHQIAQVIVFGFGDGIYNAPPILSKVKTIDPVIREAFAHRYPHLDPTQEKAHFKLVPKVEYVYKMD